MCLLEEFDLACGEPVENAAGIGHLDTKKIFLRLSRQLIHMVEIRHVIYTLSGWIEHTEKSGVVS